MNNKDALIKRMSEIYSSPIPFSYISSCLVCLLSYHSQIHSKGLYPAIRAVEKGNHSALTDALWGAVTAQEAIMRNAALFRSLTTFTPMNNSTATAEIEGILARYPDTSYSRDILSVPMGSIVLEGQDLGKFITNLNLDRLQEGGPGEALTFTCSKYISKMRYVHPHISVDGQLCFGEMTTAVWQSAVTGRLLDLLVIIDTLLHTYTPQSTYINLKVLMERYAEYAPCQLCGACTTGRMQICCCGRTVCPNCIHTCHICGYYCCGDCGNVCSICGKLFCSYCSKLCSYCESIMCVDCYEKGAMCNGIGTRHRPARREDCTISEEVGDTIEGLPIFGFYVRFL